MPLNKAAIAHNFSKAARTYNQHAALQRTICNELVNHSHIAFSSSPYVIDAGCGTGYLYHACKSASIPIISIDLAWEMCRYVQHQIPGAIPLHADMEELPFANHSIPFVFSSLALQWSADLFTALQELRRVLAPGGYFAISIFTNGTLTQLQQCFLHLASVSPIHSFVTIKDLQTFLKEASFLHYHLAGKKVEVSYPNLLSLLHDIKKIGAQTSAYPTSLLTKNRISMLEATYHRLYSRQAKEAITVSWHVAYIWGRIP